MSLIFSDSVDSLLMSAHKGCLFSSSPPDDSVLHLTFYYLMNLNIMTVKARVTTATELITPISAGYRCRAAVWAGLWWAPACWAVPGSSLTWLGGASRPHWLLLSRPQAQKSWRTKGIFRKHSLTGIRAAFLLHSRWQKRLQPVVNWVGGLQLLHQWKECERETWQTLPGWQI